MHPTDKHFDLTIQQLSYIRFCAFFFLVVLSYHVIRQRSSALIKQKCNQKLNICLSELVSGMRLESCVILKVLVYFQNCLNSVIFNHKP